MDISMLVLVVSAALFCSPVMAVCPYSVPACVCSGSSLVCRNLASIPPLATTNADGNITSLTFTSGKFDIASNSLPINLQSLAFSDVSITSISPDAFSGSATTLKSLSMSKVKYTELPDALLQVNSLTQINLSDMNITNWKSPVLESLGKTLRTVVFQNVGLNSWPEWLQSFSLVNSLDLSRNGLRTISVDAFNKVQNLTSLYLVSTNIGEEANLNAALRPLIGTLQILDVSDSTFGYIPQVISNMSKLEKLKLSDNLIDEITADRIPLQLKELDLYGNKQLSNLGDNSFPSASSLEVLNLDGTFLSVISDLAFEPLKHLRVLYLPSFGSNKVPLALTKLQNLDVLQINGLVTCPCPRDDRLVKWYQSYKKLQLSGTCKNEDFSVQFYLTNTTGQSPCSGNGLVAFNVFLYFFVLVAVGVFLL